MTSRIAFCITTLDTGGAERQRVEFVTRLPREKFEPAFVVLSTAPRPPRDELVHQLGRHGVVEMLGDEHDGQVTPTDDPQAFVEVVVRIAGDAALYDELLAVRQAF